MNKILLILILIFQNLLSFDETTTKFSNYNCGLIELIDDKNNTITVFYPTLDNETVIEKTQFKLNIAVNGKIEHGNNHLILFSHGSGGSPWVHTDLAKTLVRYGFTVAFPQHFKDNYLDSSSPGPNSWKLRPKEISYTIDFLQKSQLFSNLQFDNVGVIGGSAGGHTVLSLAGGEWSEKSFKEHCNKYIKEDFSSCVGFIMLLNNNWLDDIKIWLATTVINYKFTNSEIYSHTDNRIKAGVVMVAYASDFLLPSLKNPKIPLGFVIAEQDINQKADFHLKAILKNCESDCEIIMDEESAGHGIMLSPLPKFEHGSISEYLLSDPKNFDRNTVIPELNLRITNFFIKYLLKSND